MSRRERIEAMLAEDPQDEFLRYSLALELHKEGEDQPSLVLLQELMSGQPPYVPAFFMAAQHLAGRSQVNEAREALRRGIEVARQQGNSHAAGEMSEFLVSLGSEGE